DDSQFTSPYSYYSQPTTMTTPGSYYLNETPMSRPAIPFFSGGMQSTNPITPQSVKRPFHLTEMDRTERTMEEYNHHADIIQRFEAALKADQMAVLQPDYRTPFQSYQDAVARLLPYHIFDYPEEDMKNNDQTSELE
ncbi:5588_t:CDS:2, partial [Acaulospora morrowiae]